MFSSSQPTAAVAAAAEMLPGPSSCGEPDDVAFGCECANPSLQIASWRHEAAQGSQAGVQAS